MDLSKLSETELLELQAANGDVSKVSTSLLEKMAGQAPSDMNIIEKGVAAAIPVLDPIGRVVDVATLGAPIRAGVAKLLEAQTGKEIAPEKKLIRGQAPSFKEMWESQGFQEGTPISEKIPGAFSPTGEEWFKLKKGGMFDVTPLGMAGGIMDIATGMGGSAVRALKETAIAQKAAAALPSLPSKYSILGTLSGVPKEAIETYAKNKSLINSLDPAAAEELAQTVSEQAKIAVAATRKNAGEALGQAIEQAGGKKIPIIDFKKMLQEAAKPPKEALKNKAAQETFAEMQAKIDQLLTKTEKVGGGLELGPDGVLVQTEAKLAQVPIGDELTATELFDLKQQLKDMGDLYGGRGGLLSVLAKKDAPLVSKKFTSSLTSATKKVDELIDKATAGASEKARAKYAELSRSADAADRYFSTPEKTLSTLSNISSPAKASARRIIGKADELYGTNLQESGKIIESAKYFNEPSIEALSGKGSTSTSRTLGGTAVGSYLGSLLEGPAGAAVGGAIGSKAFSPFAVKNIYLPLTEAPGKISSAAQMMSSKLPSAITQSTEVPAQVWLKMLQEQKRQGEQQ